MIKKISKTIYQIFKSNKFFYVVVGILVIQAAWFALTAQYPMAFDENYHFGLIQIFSHQWLPFITKPPTNAAVFGEITRFDSYLYHYLMSFPYRLIALFIHQQVAQIIILRFINIGIFVGGLFLFRRLLRRVHISNALTNFSLLMLVLIPVVPFLAATITYDNLTFLLVPLIAILTLNCRDEIVEQHRIPAPSFIFLLTVGMLGSLVKYPFLPIFAAAIVYLLIIFVRTPAKANLLKTLIKSFTVSKHWLQVILVISLIISGGLFIERYGVNLVQYHSLEPDCGRINSVSYCIQYGPWARNYNHSIVAATTNPALDPPFWFFVPFWLGNMVYRLYFAVNYDYSSALPLPIPIAVASIIGAVGLVLCFVFWKYIIRFERRLLLFGAIIALYIGGLFYVNFSEYLQYRTTVAINGRYLIIVLPLIFAWVGLAFQHLFKIMFKRRVQSFVAIFSVVIILLLLQGGGALTHLVRSEPNWYWQNKTIINFNTTLKKIASTLIIGERWY
jgi:hypothetical protein